MELNFEPYTLHSDGQCFWITKAYKQKNGKTAEKRITGYFRTIEQCMDDLSEHIMRESEATELVTVLKELKDTKKNVTKSLSGAVRKKIDK